MRRSKFTDEQILGIVREGGSGAEGCRPGQDARITEQTSCRWRAKYGGMELSEMQRLQAARGRTSPPEADRRRADPRPPGRQGRRREILVTPIGDPQR